MLLVEDALYTNSEKVPGADDPEAVGGMRIFDLANPRKPRFVNYIEAEGRGVHRPIH
ncbi:MAG: hypothetical protein HYY66_02330, partial [Candidatus Tectomicrobia bacterium]|nr:hypothetical protein [Candidatus Tectomicrobia bacterium]